MIEVAHPDLTEAVYTQRVIWNGGMGENPPCPSPRKT
jgi:hypothetical protein